LFLISTCLVICGNYLAVRILARDAYPEYSGGFFGRCAGSFVFPAVGVFLYYKLRNRHVPDAKKLMLISTWALLPTFLGLRQAMQQNPTGLSTGQLRHEADLLRYSDHKASDTMAKDKWDRASLQFYSDLRAFGQQYISDISKTEADVPKLLTIGSFRDAATITNESSRIQALLQINQKYASLDPLLDKMKGYVDALDATAEDKRKFLEGFNSGARPFLRQRSATSRLERTWLLSSAELYKFALAHKNEYSLEDKNLRFHNDRTLEIFNAKLAEARSQYSDFLRAYHTLQLSQDAAPRQVGLQRSDLLTPKHNEPSPN
jgi:hypothetical protein